MNKAYKIIMSRGDDIQIDADELQNVLNGIKTGNPVITRQGIFNPSFYISVVKDTKRTREFFEECKYNDTLRSKGIKTLKDVFKDSPLRLNS